MLCHTPIVKMSAALHAGAGASLLFAPGMWPAALAAVAVNHGVLCAAGLWPQSQLLGKNLVRLPAAATARGEIALTIDDGPDPEVTPRVLDLLDEACAKATFFCIGERGLLYPSLVRDIVARGHAVENHSQHHLKRFSLLGPQKMQCEIAIAQQVLADLTGELPRFFRPTAGLRNPFLEPILARLDLQLATWSRRAYDTRQGNSTLVHDRLTRVLAPGDIFLMHDGNAAITASGLPVIVAMLPQLLRTIQQAGLTPVTLRAATEG